MDSERGDLFDFDNMDLMENPCDDDKIDWDDISDDMDCAYFSTVGGDNAEDHEVDRKFGSVINSDVLINVGGMAL
eukprot:9532185-Ditylum_brightwellii.AAC.1